MGKAKTGPTIEGLLREAQYWMMHAHDEAFHKGCDRTCSYHRLNRQIDRAIGKAPAPKRSKKTGT